MVPSGDLPQHAGNLGVRRVQIKSSAHVLALQNLAAIFEYLWSKLRGRLESDLERAKVREESVLAQDALGKVPRHAVRHPVAAFGHRRGPAGVSGSFPSAF